MIKLKTETLKAIEEYANLNKIYEWEMLKL